MSVVRDEAVAAVAPVIEALGRLGVAYYIGGSAASSVFGVPRSTMDIDLVADLRDEHVAPLVEHLKATYYIDARMIRDAIARRSCFNLIHLPTSFKVDMFVVKDRAYDRAAMARVRKDSLGLEDPSAFCLASPEDTVLSKLEWYRLGDEVSERQWRDVLGVLKVQYDSLDRPYMAKWAAELGVADLLEKAWKEAGV